MVIQKVNIGIKKTVFNIMKDRRLLSFIVIFILVLNTLTVDYGAKDNALNISTISVNHQYIYYNKTYSKDGGIQENSFKILSNQKQCNYTLPITFNSSVNHFQKGYIYQQLIQLNRSKIPEINSKFSNLYFSYGNGTKIYAWIMNITGNTANIWLRLKFNQNFKLWINIGPKNLSLFGNNSFLGYGVLFFNAPLVFGTPRVPRAWDFAGTSLPNGFINSGTNYTVDNGLYISGGNTHYGTIFIPGTYNNNTGILADMQISANGHSRIGQNFYYIDNGTRTYSANFWYFYNSYYFTSENRGPNVNTEISNYGYNVIGINDSLRRNVAYGSFDDFTFSEPNTPVSNASHFSDYTYSIGSSYYEQFSNYSWVVIRTIPPCNIMPKYLIGKIQKTYSVIFKSENLPKSSDWYINVTGDQMKETFFVTQLEFTINLQKGGYSYEIGNSTSYYPVNPVVNFNLSGNTIIIPVKFDEFAFLRVFITPWSSSLILNGKVASASEWVYNNGFLRSAIYCDSMLPGNYNIKIDENDYYNYSENVTLSSGKLLSLNITLSPKTTSFNYNYMTIFIVIIVVSFSSIFYLTRRRRD